MKGLFMVTLALFAGLAVLTLLSGGVAMAGHDNTAIGSTQLSRLDELSGSEAQLYGLPMAPEMGSNGGHGSEKASGSSRFAANAAERHWYDVEKETHWYPNGLGDM